MQEGEREDNGLKGWREKGRRARYTRGVGKKGGTVRGENEEGAGKGGRVGEVREKSRGEEKRWDRE